MTKTKNLWNLSATREVTSAARPSRIPSQGCVEPQSTLASHQKIRPVKPGPGWSNLKLFPKLTPTQRASHGSGTICTTLHYLAPDCTRLHQIAESRAPWEGGARLCEPQLSTSSTAARQPATYTPLNSQPSTFNLLFNSREPFLHHSAPLFALFTGTPVANQ